MDDKDNLRWCPAPNCEYAVDCAIGPKQLKTIVPTVTCSCGHHFCFGCGQNDHQPCPCALVKKWVKKCEDDSETANWISANTKECPKCVATIEKNGGCNHMTWYDVFLPIDFNFVLIHYLAENVNTNSVGSVWVLGVSTAQVGTTVIDSRKGLAWMPVIIRQNHEHH